MRIYSASLLVATLLSAGCLSAPESSDDPNTLPPVDTAPPGTSGNEDTTYDHENDTEVDPWELLDRQQDEGPAEFSAKLHSCPKVKYGNLGRFLASRGVNMAATGATTAGQIYRTSDAALGVANYAARVGETTELTTASAARLYDIWVAAAPEIIANIGAAGGACPGVALFDGDACNINGISCLIGMEATQTHVELCNTMVTGATSVNVGKTIAVATLASAVHTCE